MAIETQGACHVGGKSGERGCFQFMSSTWAYWSTRLFGHVAEMTAENEMAVALFKIQEHINQGYTDTDIALIWNQGNNSPCKAGVNSKGVKYDSCAYVSQFQIAMR